MITKPIEELASTLKELADDHYKLAESADRPSKDYKYYTHLANELMAAVNHLDNVHSTLPDDFTA